VQAKHGACDGGRLGPNFHAAPLNAAELETSAKIVEKAVQGHPSLDGATFFQAGSERCRAGTEAGNRNQTAGAAHQQATTFVQCVQRNF
jgi:hypothetical protein